LKLTRMLLFLTVWLLSTLSPVSAANASSLPSVYVQFATNSISTYPGDHKRVIVQYGNNTSAPVHIQYLTCAYSYQYGDIGSIYKGYFQTAFPTSGKFLRAVIYQEHTMVRYQSTSVSFVIDISPTPNILHEGQPTSATCDLHLDDGVLSASAPIVGPFQPADGP